MDRWRKKIEIPADLLLFLSRTKYFKGRIQILRKPQKGIKQRKIGLVSDLSGRYNQADLCESSDRLIQFTDKYLLCCGFQHLINDAAKHPRSEERRVGK